MPQITFSGSLSVAPTTSADGTFPGGVTTVPLSLSTSPKIATAAAGVSERIVSSPSAYVTLSGVGANDTVTQGTTLYLKTNGPILARLTFSDASTAILPLSGMNVFEFDPTKTLALLEVKGSATVEWLVTGPQ